MTKILKAGTDEYLEDKKAAFAHIKKMMVLLADIKEMQNSYAGPIHVAHTCADLFTLMAAAPQSAWKILWDQKSLFLVELLKWRYGSLRLKCMEFHAKEQELHLDGTDLKEGLVLKANEDGSFILEGPEYMDFSETCSEMDDECYQTHAGTKIHIGSIELFSAQSIPECFDSLLPPPHGSETALCA